MNRAGNRVICAIGVATLSAAIGFSGGCETSAQTGALGGAGIGALAGQAIGGNTQATLIGAAAGAGIGYIIGNEKDKAEAKTMSAGSREHNYTHTQVTPLGGTRWKVTMLDPHDFVPSYTSKVVEFREYGRVITTTTNPDGTVDVHDESYRIVDNTLIVNKPGYLINAKYRIEGNRLYVDAQDFHAVLQRL
jgi:hypothetical protein